MISSTSTAKGELLPFLNIRPQIKLKRKGRARLGVQMPIRVRNLKNKLEYVPKPLVIFDLLHQDSVSHLHAQDPTPWYEGYQ